MMNKQSLVVGLLLERLADSKVGILVKGINGIQPDEIAAELSSQRKTHIYMAAVGYGISTDVEKSEYTLTPSIEKAVLWRSVPEYAGNIVVFVKTDTDKLHSLAEFDVISLRDVSKYLLELQISNESNALRRISGVHCSRPQITIPLKLLWNLFSQFPMKKQ